MNSKGTLAKLGRIPEQLPGLVFNMFCFEFCGAFDDSFGSLEVTVPMKSMYGIFAYMQISQMWVDIPWYVLGFYLSLFYWLVGCDLFVVALVVAGSLKMMVQKYKGGFPLEASHLHRHHPWHNILQALCRTKKTSQKCPGTTHKRHPAVRAPATRPKSSPCFAG